MKRRRFRRSSRRGAATVEFALVVPVFLTIILGVVEASRLYENQNLLSTAAREGARLAAMDRDGLVAEGQSTNDKVKEDIKNFLEASGLDREQIDVTITHVDDPDADFDLDDPDNSLELFEVRVELPYSAVAGIAVPEGVEMGLAAKVVFRNGRATLAN